MTIRDMIEQGVQIQGAFQIKKYIDEDETYDVLADGTDFEAEFSDIEEDVLDMEIKYTYSIPMPTGMVAWTVFEVE